MGAGETRSLVISTFNLAGLDEIMQRANIDREEVRAKNQALDQTTMWEEKEDETVGKTEPGEGSREPAWSRQSQAAQTGLRCCFEYRLKNPLLRENTPSRIYFNVCVLTQGKQCGKLQEQPDNRG